MRRETGIEISRKIKQLQDALLDIGERLDGGDSSICCCFYKEVDPFESPQQQLGAGSGGLPTVLTSVYILEFLPALLQIALHHELQ